VKVFIITVAVIILYSFTICFTQDYRQAQRNSYRLKYVCEELSATGASFYDLEEYSDGFTMFNTGEGIVYFYDDSGICKIYANGSLEREEAFTYGDMHKDDWTSYNAVISDPTVVVTINAGPGRFRFKFLNPLPDIVRSASHEWEDR